MDKMVYNISKELGVVEGSPWQLQDITESITTHQVTPGLLTALLNPKKIYNMTDTFRYDALDYTQQLPVGKGYSMRGEANLTTDKPYQKHFAIPSFGLMFNALPKDWAGMRRFGTSNEVKTEADVIAELQMKANKAWTLFTEIGMAQLLTEDSNYIASGPFTEYDFYEDITGGSRGSAVAMELDDDTANHMAIMREEVDKLRDECEKAGVTYTGFDCICGNTTFNQRVLVEENTGLAREMRQSLDIASEEIPMSSFNTPGSFQYANFVGARDGIRYINYGAGITGTPMIGDTEAYLIPRGADFMQLVYAPAQTRSYVNTQALEAYSWTKTDEFKGVSVFQEKNILFFNPRPKLVRVLSNT